MKWEDCGFLSKIKHSERKTLFSDLESYMSYECVITDGCQVNECKKDDCILIKIANKLGV